MSGERRIYFFIELGLAFKGIRADLACDREQYPASSRLMNPVSNPTYYTDLMQELDEAPDRGWFARLMAKWKGRIRMQ